MQVLLWFNSDCLHLNTAATSRTQATFVADNQLLAGGIVGSLRSSQKIDDNFKDLKMAVADQAATGKMEQISALLKTVRPRYLPLQYPAEGFTV